MRLTSKEQLAIRDKYGAWAVVTGATSGIGLAIARELAGAGLNLVVNSRSTNRLQLLAAELVNDYAIEVKVVQGDLSEEKGVEALIDASAGLPVGLLVASAGFGTSGLLVESDLGLEVNLLKVNVEAVLQLTYCFGQKFAQQQRGGIILLSSMVAFQGVPFSANYSATKAYVQTLAEGLYHELKPYGVAVLAAAPGPVNTKFAERADLELAFSASPGKVAVPILRALGKRATVLPGSLTKLLVYALRSAPRFARVRIMGKIMSRMTAHQKEDGIA